LETDDSVSPNIDYPDYVNTVSWRRLIQDNAIAVTFAWRDLDSGYTVDCDIVMNMKHKWDIDPDGEETGTTITRAFDVCNIFTHEAGHVVGLADLYDDLYRELTMFGYGSKGETQKISLENGDQLGCQDIYGN